MCMNLTYFNNYLLTLSINNLRFNLSKTRKCCSVNFAIFTTLAIWKFCSSFNLSIHGIIICFCCPADTLQDCGRNFTDATRTFEQAFLKHLKTETLKESRGISHVSPEKPQLVSRKLLPLLQQ